MLLEDAMCRKVKGERAIIVVDYGFMVDSVSSAIRRPVPEQITHRASRSDSSKARISLSRTGPLTFLRK